MYNHRCRNLISQAHSHQDLLSDPRGKTFARSAVMPKRFVYVLRNHETPARYYTGVTSDVATRHAEHNSGSCTITRPSIVRGQLMS